MQEDEREPMTPDTSGLSSVRPFASYNPASRSWRTWTAIEVSDSTEWSQTWPKTGCMSDGLSYQLPAWEPHTDASDCSSPSLPTPRATRGGSSTETTMLLPSPTTSDANGAGAHGTGGPDLRTALAGMSRLCDAWTARMKGERATAST